MKRTMCFLLASMLVIYALQTEAQKLPHKQEVSVYLPNDVKIDGLAKEWNNQFQAFNTVTDIFYTIANDDNLLYLVASAKDPDIIRKIVIGGITFTINSSSKKSDKNSVAVTFPTYDRKNHPLFLVLNVRPQLQKDTAKATMRADSLMNEYNNQISNKLKIIGVAGIKTVTDSVLSIYNEEGIKAISRFDNKLNYTYELAVPLPLLGLGTNNKTKFSYNIKLNGEAASGTNIKILPTSRGDIISFTGADGINYNLGHATPENMNMASPTDFWGEYTLAKKP